MAFIVNNKSDHIMRLWWRRLKNNIDAILLSSIFIINWSCSMNHRQSNLILYLLFWAAWKLCTMDKNPFSKILRPVTILLRPKSKLWKIKITIHGFVIAEEWALWGLNTFFVVYCTWKLMCILLLQGRDKLGDKPLFVLVKKADWLCGVEIQHRSLVCSSLCDLLKLCFRLRVLK